MNHRTLIDVLVDDLRPVRPAMPLPPLILYWTSLAWIFVTSAILWTGPLREGAIAALATSPRYAVEFLIAILASIAASVAGFELGVPGRSGHRRRLLSAGGLLVVWLSIVAYGLIDPAIETGSSGARPFCDLQTLAFSLPPLALALFVLTRRALFARGMSGVLLGAGAAAIPAASMQLACLYDPLHALIHHLAPVVIVAALGGLVARWTVRRS